MASNQNSKDLSSLVQDECGKLGLSFIPQMKEDLLTEKEKMLVQQTSFPDELKFSVPVDISYSKKAFVNFMTGLSGEVTFEDLWKPKELDLRADYHPSGGQDDLSFLKDTDLKDTDVQASGWKHFIMKTTHFVICTVLAQNCTILTDQLSTLLKQYNYKDEYFVLSITSLQYNYWHENGNTPHVATWSEYVASIPCKSQKAIH